MDKQSTKTGLFINLFVFQYRPEYFRISSLFPYFLQRVFTQRKSERLMQQRKVRESDISIWWSVIPCVYNTCINVSGSALVISRISIPCMDCQKFTVFTPGLAVYTEYSRRSPVSIVSYTGS